MDHVPAVAREIEQVPYAAGEVFDNESFFGFPRRRGWDKVLKSHDYTNVDVGGFASFLQAWLFFGLLAEILTGVKLNTADFIRKSSHGRQYITTEKLKWYLQQWRDGTKDIPRKEQSQRMIRMELALDEARTLVSQFCSVKDADDKSVWPIDPLISLSFMILGETLSHAKTKVLGMSGSNLHGWQDNIKGGWGKSKVLLQRMKQRGWCPNSVHMLQGLMSGQVSGLYYVSSFHRPRSNNHHDSCTAAECKAGVNPAFYTPKHRDPRCKCQMLGPSLESLEQIIQKGGIPLLSYSKETERLEVIQFEEHMKYVTISHVWTDGICNPEANTLPKCQIKFLNDLALELNKSKFWIDTLAIPTGGSARKMAIRNMHTTYTLADKTIVLDAELMEARRGNDYIETAMRITISGWMRRLWTLQEGLLSKNLYFKFFDELVEMESLEELFPSANSSLESSVPEAARTYYHGLMRSTTHEEKNRKDLVAPVWKATQWRKTSHPKDETLAIATLLNIDPKLLLQVSDDFEKRPGDEAGSSQDVGGLQQRMQFLLSELGDLDAIPPGMIFLPGPRLLLKGFGWAPQTWMGGHKVDHPDPLSIPGPAARLVSRGLVVQYPGFKLHSLSGNPWTIVRPPGLGTQDQGSKSSPEENERFWFPANKLLLEWYMVEKDAVIDRSAPADNSPELALILPRQGHAATPEIALLVSVSEERNQIFYVTALGRVWVSLETRQSHIPELRENFKESLDSIWGEALSPDQQWCVDGWFHNVSLWHFFTLLISEQYFNA
jgi:hypothetical protein